VITLRTGLPPTPALASIKAEHDKE